MNRLQFISLAKAQFGKVLNPKGFVCDRSKSSVFYREIVPGFFHVITPDCGRTGEWYDVKVFPFASEFDPMWEMKFPDDVGIPTDTYCYLSDSGVGPDQTQFNCRTESSFLNQFDSKVSRLLEFVALPYLEQFRNLPTLMPHIQNELYRAIATFYVQGANSAHNLLLQQKKRLETIGSKVEAVVAMRCLVDKLLNSVEEV